MSSIGVGAEVHAGHCKSKKLLKETIAENPRAVYFYGTSAFGPSFGEYADDVPRDTVLTVVGPDPYTDRRWYATVTVTHDGTIKVT